CPIPYDVEQILVLQVRLALAEHIGLHRDDQDTVGMPPLRKSFFRSDDVGAAIFEVTIVLPVLVLLTFGLMEVSRALWMEIALIRATDDAARCGAMNHAKCDYNTPSSIQTY